MPLQHQFCCLPASFVHCAAAASRHLAAVQAALAADADLGQASLQAGPSDVCSTDSRRTNWGLTLLQLKPSHAFISTDNKTLIRQCFALDIGNDCNDVGESEVSCCQAGRGPQRLDIRVGGYTRNSTYFGTVGTHTTAPTWALLLGPGCPGRGPPPHHTASATPVCCLSFITSMLVYHRNRWHSAQAASQAYLIHSMTEGVS